MLADAVTDRRLAVESGRGSEAAAYARASRTAISTHAQLDALADACGDYRTLILTLGYCGIRWGEAAALRVGRVDVLRGRLDIAESVTEVGGVATFGTTKTDKRRSVSVPGFLRSDLARAVDGRGRDDFVFPAWSRGARSRVGNFRRGVWNDACVAVGRGRDGRRPRVARNATKASLRTGCATRPRRPRSRRERA